ncbi:MAG: hypothetical protein Q8O67_16760 [Deltaproteobacteria bacterium]|nr:hypothetical protein [Deltaproteobacteria bacterium]
MAEVTRRIGLSLGADICWPLCFEQILKKLDLKIPVGGDTVRFDCERVTIEPFDLQQPCNYDVVIDRLTHWYHTSREWIKKSIIMDDLYVFNNPWSVQSNEKHTSYCAMMHLGMPIPKTWMIPPKSYEKELPDVKATLGKYARLFDLGKLGDKVGWPMYLKPYDGGGWRSVTRVGDAKAAWKAYEESGKAVMHAQASVEGFDLFVRCIGFGPQTKCVLYDPSAPLHDRYTLKTDFMSAADAEHLRKVTVTINAFFGWDFNSCEALRVPSAGGAGGVWHPIDFANPCPDSQVTSLHGHFPWLVKSYLRWAIFCAATQRKMRRTLDWQPFYDVAAMELSYEEKLDRYAAIADERMGRHQFEEFCAKHLGHLDDVANEFFGSAPARDAVRQKTAALFPAHEVEKFTELFWQRIQAWRAAGIP